MCIKLSKFISDATGPFELTDTVVYLSIFHSLISITEFHDCEPELAHTHGRPYTVLWPYISKSVACSRVLSEDSCLAGFHEDSCACVISMIRSLQAEFKRRRAGDPRRMDQIPAYGSRDTKYGNVM